MIYRVMYPGGLYLGLCAMRHQEAVDKSNETSELVKELRRRLGLTQEKFAARVGVTFPTVNRWENDRATPSPLAMHRIAECIRSMGKGGADLLYRYFPREAWEPQDAADQ
jgi:transcriptional regulator with XRE-family HTH domain